MKLSDQVYNVIKWAVVLLLPALATLYAALAAAWGWPCAQEITTTITAVDTFLGAILCISTANYRTGGTEEESGWTSSKTS